VGISQALDEVISRRTLFDRRKARSTVVVVGSAGYGQSVLLSHWARSISWFSWWTGSGPFPTLRNGPLLCSVGVADSA
jgi:hypothetical protein